MKYIVRKIFTGFVSMVVIFSQFVTAADVANFVIQLNPTSPKMGEATDMTIKAVDANGTVVKDYKGLVMMDFDGYQDTSSYEMPSNGYYQFTEADQGEKLFSKWLVIKKSGQYTLKVYDADKGDEAQGKLPVTIAGTEQVKIQEWEKIQIQEPLSGATLQSSAINVIGETKSRKTPVQFFIDGQKLDFTSQTDDSWVFSVYLTGMTGGAHMLQVKTVDYQGTVIGTSDEIPFAYTAPATDNFLKSFTAHPSGVMQLGQTVQFDATVDTTVRSIELKVGSAGTFVMDKKSDGVFAKPLVIDKEGVHKVDVTLILDGGQKMPYMDRATLDVHAPLFGVGQLKVVNNAADPSKAALSWSAIGSPTGYVVRYGLKQDDLASEVKVPTTQVEISGLAIGKQYFFQIFALDEKGQVAGKASDIAMIMTQGQSAAGEQEQVAAPSCTVVGIKLRTEKVGDQYFLVWDAIPGAVEYHVYKSDFEVKSITSMQKVATTTVPKFVYPFNAQAKKDEYTYYSVVATCSDGKNLQIDNVKKVHTWPVSDMLLLFFVSLMGYMLFRIYRYNH